MAFDLQSPADFTQPEEREIAVWQVDLDVSVESLPRLSALLSEDEQARARRFVFEKDRRRFAVGRATLRILLSRCLDMKSDQVCFGYGANGKPYLKGAIGSGRLHFNVSHSDSLALIAVCAGAELGVDVELVREMDDMESIVRRFFCPQEVEQWIGLPNELRTRAFFDCWTRKEAYVKAIGDGLLLPLDRFQVDFRPGEAPGIRVRGNGDGQLWSILDVSPSPRYAGALAIPGSGWQLRLRTAVAVDVMEHLP
jgi:4'-phosphopantetheinyl transferase